MNVSQAQVQVPLNKKHILVVEDEEDILELIRYNLSKEGFKVTCANSGELGLSTARQMKPDLILLDLMLPGIDGFDVCRALRGEPDTRHIPIIMITAKGEEPDMVTGLELGADDYVVKPFSPRVLLARIKSVMRRHQEGPIDSNAVIRLEALTVDPTRHQVTLDGKPLELTATEFRLLHFLAARPGWVFSRYQIVDAVHGEDYPVTDRSIDVQIVGLRKKLGDHAQLIETVRGVGYRFKG